MFSFAFSPCPNDTFAFHALVHGLVDGPAVTPQLEDIETLNELAERGATDIVKMSVAAYGRVAERYALLRSGGAAGFGTGPILVAREEREPGGLIAIPGKRTTAALLLGLLGTFETKAMRFDEIPDAVLSGEVECGVLIHEGRFTFEDRGLVLVRDLGEAWESRHGLPVPLGAVAVRREIGDETARELESAVRASVAYGHKHPEASRDYVAAHARELAPEVIARHIELYVNEYTLDLDETAVTTLLGDLPVPVFVS